MGVRRWHLGLTAPILASALLPGCASNFSAACTPTALVTPVTSKVVTGSVLSSLSVTVTLRTTGGPLPGKTVAITFTDDTGSNLATKTPMTGAKGTATVDAKTAGDAQLLVALARATSYSASFAGDSSYCSSDGTGDINLAK